MTQFADIAVILSLDKCLTYELPETTLAQIGSRVLIEVGSKKRVGFVVDIHSRPPVQKTKKVKEVLDPKPLFSAPYFEWLKWASQYYIAPLGDVLQTALPSLLLKPLSQQKIQNKKIRHSPLKDHWSQNKNITLNSEQNTILTSLEEQIKTKQFSSSLLFGVTGSGKTEIYLRLSKKILEQGQQVLILVPEIGLTPQMVAQFHASFGNRLGLYHSGLTENQRLIEWMRAKDGKADVIIGTRSALFTPLPRLGAIIIDEEQDGSYKQEERFRYHARDLALVRGKIENCLVLLGSATPSLESFYNSIRAKFKLLKLEYRIQGARAPQIKLVNMAAQKRQTNSPLSLSQELSKALNDNLKRGEQTLILINQRGFARCFFCLSCEKTLTCPHCSVNLTYHRKNQKLLCHYCDTSLTLPKKCPQCQSSEVTLLGIGTETIEEEIKTYFPKARIARLDRDSTKKKGVLIRTLKDLKDHKIDILVGTQMIAKGHDFPRVTLVGVLGIDVGLGIPDFRAAENTFQLLTQVAGRSGRGELPGQVIIQSYTPEHYSIQLACAGDYETFFKTELKYRKELNYPPIGKLIQFKFRSSNENNLMIFIRNLQQALEQFKKKFPDISILGPAPAPIEKIKGQFRWHLLLKGIHRKSLHAMAFELKKILTQQLKPSSIKWAIDVDPIGML